MLDDRSGFGDDSALLGDEDEAERAAHGHAETGGALAAGQVVDNRFQAVGEGQCQGGRLARAEPPFEDHWRNLRRGPNDQPGRVLDGLRRDVAKGTIDPKKYDYLFGRSTSP